MKDQSEFTYHVYVNYSAQQVHIINDSQKDIYKKVHASENYYNASTKFSEYGMIERGLTFAAGLTNRHNFPVVVMFEVVPFPKPPTFKEIVFDFMNEYTFAIQRACIPVFFFMLFTGRIRSVYDVLCLPGEVKNKYSSFPAWLNILFIVEFYASIPVYALVIYKAVVWLF